jgi:hypothetical protein
MLTPLFILPPEMIAIIILGLFSGIELVIIVKVGNVLRAYAKMLVMKTRIMSDGAITLEDADLLPFVKSTIDLMNELEGILHIITGYILNHPSTGWIKAYVPEVQGVVDAAVQQLANEEAKNTATQVLAQTVEQPTQPVSTLPGE